MLWRVLKPKPLRPAPRRNCHTWLRNFQAELRQECLPRVQGAQGSHEHALPGLGLRCHHAQIRGQLCRWSPRPVALCSLPAPSPPPALELSLLVRPSCSAFSLRCPVPRLLAPTEPEGTTSPVDLSSGGGWLSQVERVFHAPRPPLPSLRCALASRPQGQCRRVARVPPPSCSHRLGASTQSWSRSCHPTPGDLRTH